MGGDTNFGFQLEIFFTLVCDNVTGGGLDDAALAVHTEAVQLQCSLGRQVALAVLGQKHFTSQLCHIIFSGGTGLQSPQLENQLARHLLLGLGFSARVGRVHGQYPNFFTLVCVRLIQAAAHYYSNIISNRVLVQTGQVLHATDTRHDLEE